MIITALPTPAQLLAAPQLGALAILDAALVTAEEVLLAHHPALEEIDGDLHDDSSPPDGYLVPVLLARFEELHFLLGRYDVAVKKALLVAYDDIPF